MLNEKTTTLFSLQADTKKELKSPLVRLQVFYLICEVL